MIVADREKKHNINIAGKILQQVKRFTDYYKKVAG